MVVIIERETCHDESNFPILFILARRDIIMKRIIFLSLSLLVLLFITIPASTKFVVYTDEESFVSALSGPQSLVNFDDVAPGPVRGNKFSAKGFIFRSPLRSPLGKLEVAPATGFYSSQYLSIDRKPFDPGEDGNDDSLNVYIKGNWYAVGFRIVDSMIPISGEFIEVYDKKNNIIYTRQSTEGAVAYFGIISDVPIGKICIKENAYDEDDAGYDDFRLGNKVTATRNKEISAEKKDNIVFMNDGSELHGEIKAQNRNTITLKTKHGVMKIQKKNIKEIRYK